MEESADGRCSVVYYCTGAGEQHVSATHHWQNPPKRRSAEGGDLNAPVDIAFANARMLLDEDQGGFHEVFVSSSSQECWDRIQSYAGSFPTVVLLESQGAKSAEKESEDPALSFLRSLTTDVQGARYQHHVMPFVIRVAPSREGGHPDAQTATDYLNAGAVETLRSPLGSEDLGRLVSHVKEEIRPRADLIGITMARNLADSIRDMSTPGKPSHRPDKAVSPARLRYISTAVQEWDFPAHELSMDELTCAALFMVEHLLKVPELAEYRIARSEIMSLLLATRRQYKHEREVHYHNWRHAVDVTQSIYIFLVYIGVVPALGSKSRSSKERTSLEQVLKPIDGLILLVSAIGHDVGHPGVNNAFLVACSHPLAQLYNDKSVLENYHCAAYTQLLRRHWPKLGSIPNFRSSMISNILATDMQRHFEYMATLGELKTKYSDGQDSISEWNDKDREHARELTMALLMKAADISNIARPFEVSSSWAKVLVSEFARQGELEEELGIPTCLFGGPPDKNDMLSAAQSQKGFMNLFGFPLFQGLSDIMPSVACSVETLRANQETWEYKIAEEQRRREAEGSKSPPLTFSSVGQPEITKAEILTHRSEPSLPSLPLTSSPSKRDTFTPASRRSSKDVALEHMHSFPSSRRGSKDESLTTILVRSNATSSATQPSSAATSSEINSGNDGAVRRAPAVPPSNTPPLRESRSRSRLRGLKFWRRRTGERGSESS